MKDGFLYQKIYDTLYERITTGFYAVGTKLPTETALHQEFDVSLITLKKALNMLAEQGLIDRIPGKGTFVKVPFTSVSTADKKLIGVILEHISSPFGLSMMYCMDEIAEANGYKLIIRFSYCSREKETSEIDFLLETGVQGLIIMPSHGQHYNPAILKLVLDKFPVVLIDKRLQGIEVPSVRTDNTAAMHKLVTYMKSCGCRHIGLITTGEHDATSTMERCEGFYQGVRAEGLHACPECIIPPQETPETPQASAQTVSYIQEYLLHNRAQIDGLVCSEYGIMAKLVKAASNLQLQLNKDIPVCCIDEDDLVPGGFTFTHMKQDERMIAEKTMELMFTRLEHGEIPGQDYLIPAIFKKKNG